MTANPPSSDAVTLGKYQIIRELGRGSMGVVYEGFDPWLERKVALKTIRKDLLQLGDQHEAASMLRRFRREAQAAARLQHPSIVVVYDYAEDGDTVFIAMELVQGKELKRLFSKQQRFGLHTCLNIMGQLLDGLAYSHRHNVVHRDIKPANIIVLDEGGQVKITDFGIARVDTSELTQAGEVMGTPSHMAPEQLLGKAVDGRADLFSAGVILYQLLTGEKPFAGGNIAAVMHSVLSDDPVAPTQRNPQLPPACDAVLAKALAKNPADRYPSADAFKAALSELLARPAKTEVPVFRTATEAAQPAPRADQPATVQGWVDLLTQQKMPLYFQTALRIQDAMRGPRVNAMEIVRIIQQNPRLATKVLELGNGCYNNPARQKLTDIGRAIMILGAHNIYTLALACSHLELANQEQINAEVSRQLACSIHAAVQAKAFATLAHDPYPEEVFLAALMRDFGRAAFYCHGQRPCAEIRRQVAAGAHPEDAERSVLGFPLKELNAALCKAWTLGGLVEESLAEIGPESSYRVKLVHYSQQLVEGLEQGVDFTLAQNSLAHIARITTRTMEALQPIVLENSKRAVKVATQLGVGHVAHFIAGAPREAFARNMASVDQRQCGRVMRDIAKILNGKIDISELLETVIGGMQTAIRMERVLFALATPDRSVLREKSSRGMDQEKEAMTFDLAGPRNLFSYALTKNRGSWISPAADTTLRQLFTHAVRSQVGLHECFVMPLSISGRPIGLFYADRAHSGRPLDRDAFTLFVELVQQANIGINLSKRQSSSLPPARLEVA